MQPLDWFVAIWEGIFQHLHRFLQYNWSLLLVISLLALFAVKFDNGWGVLDYIASAYGAVLARFYQLTKENGFDWLWWPLLLSWLLVAVPFFLVVMVSALIVNGLDAVFRLALRRSGNTPNAA